MNGVHDMGGMACYGRVVREDNEPCFHAPWERRVFGMTMLALGRIDTLDAFRHAVERMDPIHYLSSTYYEHWLAALEMLAVEKGLFTPEELASGVLRGTGGATEPPLPPEAVRQVVAHGASCDRNTGRLIPRFAPGDRVKAKNVHVVCTLCSCYPWPVLGLPPTWYKMAPYRSRVAIDPRGVLHEFGVDLPASVEVRVWDSSAGIRYMVLPERPPGTAHMSEQELAMLVTRDTMIGVARVEVKS